MNLVQYPISAIYFFTGMSRIIRNVRTAWFRKADGSSPWPVLVVLRLTENCNIRCKMCYDRSPDIREETWSWTSPGQELSEEEYRSLINELAVFAPTFYLTGGEPLLAPTLFPVISAIKSKGMYVSMNTNGSLLAGKAKQLVDSGIDRIIISLDGPREIHDSIRDKTFEAISAGIRAIGELKKTVGRRTPALRTQCTISPYNTGSLLETVIEAERLGLDEIRFQHLMFASPQEAFRLDEPTKSLASRARISTFVLKPGAIDIKALKDQVSSILARNNRLTVRFEPDIRIDDLGQYYGDGPDSFTDLCLGPWRRLVISSTGDMGPCQGIYFGQYPGTTPQELWNSDSFRGFRRNLMSTGLFPYCRRCCHREYYSPGTGPAVS